VKLLYQFDLLADSQLQWTALTQLTHPSECWGLAFRYDWLGSRKPVRHEMGLELLLNLTGTGFMGFSQGGSSGESGVFGGI
jgi:hypothetical protein